MENGVEEEDAPHDFEIDFTDTSAVPLGFSKLEPAG